MMTLGQGRFFFDTNAALYLMGNALAEGLPSVRTIFRSFLKLNCPLIQISPRRKKLPFVIFSPTSRPLDYDPMSQKRRSHSVDNTG